MSAMSSLVLAFLPTDVADFVRHNILDPRSSFQMYTSQAIGLTRQGIATATPVVQNALQRAGLDVSGVDVSKTLAATIIAMIAFAAVNYVIRTVMWWTRFTFRILYWVMILAVGMWVYENGVMESAKDVVVIGGKFVGYLAGVKDVWMSEYERYESQQQHGFGSGGSSGR